MADRPSGRKETEDERLDRNLGELLQELRVALPGVQVLFAFLLAVPFSARFKTIDSFEKNVYFATLLCTAVSAVLLISPSAYHRVTFHFQQKREMIKIGNRATIVGLGFLALAMVGAVVMITDVLFGGATTYVVGAAVFSMFLLFWYVLPLWRRIKLIRQHGWPSDPPPAP
jgi:O-antigen/teichoic acid export membrane protein